MPEIYITLLAVVGAISLGGLISQMMRGAFYFLANKEWPKNSRDSKIEFLNYQIQQKETENKAVHSDYERLQDKYSEQEQELAGILDRLIKE